MQQLLFYPRPSIVYLLRSESEFAFHVLNGIAVEEQKGYAQFQQRERFPQRQFELLGQQPILGDKRRIVGDVVVGQTIENSAGFFRIYEGMQGYGLIQQPMLVSGCLLDCVVDFPLDDR